MTESPGAAPRRLSDILLATGLVSQEQIEAGLRAQKRTRRLLGETLVELGFITEDDLGWALSNHLGLPYVEIDMTMLDDSLKTLLPAGLMREHRLLPMLRTGDTLQIAMADPTHTTIVGDVERLTGLTAQVCLAGAHQLARLLDEWLGPEMAPAESSDDLLFREITRPTNPLGPVFICALREKVREILMDPQERDVRVRFRTAEGLSDQPPLDREAYDVMVERLHAALSAIHPRPGGETTWSSVMPFAEGTLRLTISLLKASEGRCLVLEIEQNAHADHGAADAPAAERLPEGVRELLAGAGLMVITGTRVATVRRAVTCLARAINTDARRVVALEDALVAPLKGMAMLRQPAEMTPEAFVTQLLEESHVDAAVAGRLRPGAVLRTACTMAACGRLILAWDLAPDPISWVATMLEAGTPRTMMALGVAGLVQAGEDAQGHLTLSAVLNSRELADAIRAGGEWKALHAAANNQGFWEERRLMDVTELLVFMRDQSASDLHLSSGNPPMLRIHGEMNALDLPPVSKEELHRMIYDIMTDTQKKTFEEKHELDFALELEGIARFRVNAFVQRRGEGAVFRIIPTEIKSFNDLKLPPVLGELALREKGLILVTGPTGSGKSTTLAAMVDHVNRKKKGHIITVEDPIEFVHDSKSCLVNQREVGPHTHSFTNALRSALREDPDVILVGELRDLETTQLAITAAETGHIVFGTLHTNSAAKTIDRVIDIFPAGQQAQIRTMFSESILGIVSQTLTKRADGRGRAAALEILVGVPALRNLIREDKTAQIMSVIQTGGQYGMQSMDQCLKNMVMEGVITREEAAKKSMNPQLFLGGPESATAPARPPLGQSQPQAGRRAA